MTTAETHSDRAWVDLGDADSGRTFHGIETRSFYLPMRDGVELAIDLWLPKDRSADDRLPAILHMTRYMRSVELRGPLRRLFLNRPFDHTMLYLRCRRRFLRRGYAWLDIDVRGSGASFGEWMAPWGPFEVRDGADIVDWVIAQPWSNGKVGATGISYDGSSAEMLAINRHPAVKAVVPRFASFEPYTDVAYPGGVFHERFIRTWHHGNDALDRNAPHEVAGQAVRLVITGVSPVDDDRDRSRRAAAVAGHANNCDVVGFTTALPFRDSVIERHPFYQVPNWASQLPGHPHEIEPTHAMISAHNYATDIDASGTAVYAYSGWFDGGYPHAAIKRFMTLKS
ncbi:MAG: X-Pro dipeptidyl-peptidase-like protein, partial [Caulobacteraceae bacterium]